MKHKSYLTAISRRTVPAPTRWLIRNGLVKMPVLDYGCGKCHSVNPPKWINYDPHHYPINLEHFRGSNLTVICNYVLCTLPKEEHLAVLKDIQSLLKVHPESVAYISVRNDKPKQGWGLSSRGTYQSKVVLPFQVIHKNAQFCIYQLTKNSVLVS